MPRVQFLASACLMLLLATVAAAQRTPPQYTAAIAPDGKTLAESYSHFDSGGPVTFHDLATNKVRFVCEGHKHYAVIAIAYSQDGRMLASAVFVGQAPACLWWYDLRMPNYRRAPRPGWNTPERADDYGKPD